MKTASGLFALAFGFDDFSIAKCDDNGVVELTALIKPSAVFFMPEGFETVQFADGVDENGAPIMVDMYQRVFPREELTKSFKNDPVFGRMLVMSVKISEPSKPYKWRDQVVYHNSGHHLDFHCNYELGDKTIRDDLTVAGHDVETLVEETGQLGYELRVIEDSYDIGTTVNFEIVPKNPDLVYASVKSCDIYKGADEANAITIIGLNSDGQEADMCSNPVISSTLSEYSSTGTLAGSWTSFKWRTDALVKNEDQTLQCNIALSEVGFNFVAILNNHYLKEKSTLTPTDCVANTSNKL